MSETGRGGVVVTFLPTKVGPPWLLEDARHVKGLVRSLEANYENPLARGPSAPWPTWDAR